METFMTSIVEQNIKSTKNYTSNDTDDLDDEYVISANGIKTWCSNAGFHRVDGPAVVGTDGHKEWYRNGKRHRTDGPAIEWTNYTVEWFIDGQKINASVYQETVISLANKLFDKESLTIHPFSQIESLLYSFKGWKKIE
jgi:hypothetical protein